MTKFKSQALDFKNWKAGGSGYPPSCIPALWHIGILLHKHAIRTKHFDPECICSRHTLKKQNFYRTYDMKHNLLYYFSL